MSETKGFVGIFWYIPEQKEWIISRMPVEEAEPYGDAITYPISHNDFWEKSKYIRLGDYIDFPRGRVVYFTDTNSFVVYFDRRLTKVIKDIFQSDWFGNPPRSVVYKTDGHYRKRPLSI